MARISIEKIFNRTPFAPLPCSNCEKRTQMVDKLENRIRELVETIAAKDKQREELRKSYEQRLAELQIVLRERDTAHMQLLLDMRMLQTGNLKGVRKENKPTQNLHQL